MCHTHLLKDNSTQNRTTFLIIKTFYFKNKDNQTTFSFCPSDEPPSSLNSPISIQSHPLEAFTKNQAEITLKEQKRPLKIIPSSKINGKIRPSIRLFFLFLLIFK